MFKNDTFSQSLPVCQVNGFSSSYGSQSYSPYNIIGEPQVYPRYGDASKSCVFRTYGQWWKKMPNHFPSVGVTPSWFSSDEFIILKFAKKLYANSVALYETYHPGCLVRIFLYNERNNSWRCGYSRRGPKIYHDNMESVCSLFQLKDVFFLCDTIRLEFDTSQSYYYTEIDAVYLKGFVQEPPINIDAIETDLDRLTIQSTSSHCSQQSLSLVDLPVFVMIKIFEFLSLDEVLNIGATCWCLRRLTMEPAIYSQLNLQPYWHSLNNDVFNHMVELKVRVTDLNLAWCSTGYTFPTFLWFLEKCCGSLKTLNLANTGISDNEMVAIANITPNLNNINVSRCCEIKNIAFISKWSSIVHLNIYGLDVTAKELISVFMRNPGLKYLNMGAVTPLLDIIPVIKALADYCCGLISLDIWRACKTASHFFFKELARLKDLEELDMGWINLPQSSGKEYREAMEAMKLFIGSSVNLKKLYLTANRHVDSHTMTIIANSLHRLEQLDILGCSSVLPDDIFKVVSKCENLVFLDYSFSHAASNKEFKEMLLKKYPRVSFKTSFTIDSYSF